MQATDIFCLKHYINLVQTAVASVPVEQNAIDCHIRILAKWASKRSVDAHFLKNIVFFFPQAAFINCLFLPNCTFLTSTFETLANSLFHMRVKHSVLAPGLALERVKQIVLFTSVHTLQRSSNCNVCCDKSLNR